ncbi:neuraminidase-like domain-containing protein [Pseudoduganella buxea]|uniref:Peptidoglycan binding-like domain-containing protein n=2 Tax=Pseudoduganella buxea TaxID=1949069 RepID=A0ABQ1KSH7_9BURK|nr:neuraminidase-like domain-containing protein [Pseudoduganella buxea]GGC05314.1 hypothetical protein GCM10011572_29030 [Pseudoduganella buxea]
MNTQRISFQSPLYPGAQGSDVAAAQAMLAELDYPVAQSERDARHYGPSTVEAVRRWRRQNELPDEPFLDLDALALLRKHDLALERVVHGVIALADGSAVGGLLVTAIDRDFRAEQELGKAVTDDGGRYRIVYRAADAVRAEKGLADVGLRIHTGDGKMQLYASRSAELAMNAPRDIRLDAVVSLPDGAVPSEFACIAATLAGLTGDVGPAAIGEDPASDEVDFLARESGIDLERLGHFAMAARVGDLAELPAAYFYGLLREDGLHGVGDGRAGAVLTPVDLRTPTRAVLFEAVLLDGKDSQRVLRRAVRKHLIGPELLEQAGAIHERLQQWRDEARKYVDHELPQRVAAVLDGVVGAGREADLVSLLTAIDVNGLPGLFERFDMAGIFSLSDRPEAQARLGLADLLGLHPGLVSEVVEGAGAGTPEQVRKLAQLERKDWSAMIERGNLRLGGAPISSASAASARRQASAIVRRFEQRYPTAAFAAQLGRRQPAAVPESEGIAALFDRHPDFDLRRHKLRPFLKAAGDEQVPAAVLDGVERVQRVFQLAGDYRKTEALLAAGYDSAAAIVAAGRGQFVRDARRAAGLGAARAADMFEAASNRNLAALTVAANLRTLDWPAALEGESAASLRASFQALALEHPDLASLFGAGDACACAHCRSIYGPAAYFADIMRFLRNRLVRDTTVTPSPSTRSAREILFARRPDLGQIDLDCANAEVPVPHIDIVCELLEEMVAPDAGFTFNAATLAAGRAPAALLAAVRAAGFQILDNAVLYGPYAGDRFMLRDPGIAIAVDGPAPNWTLRRLRQTHGTPAERAAAPEYVNADAHMLLAAGKAAFGLPFDLFHAETVALLNAAGSARADLMRALKTPAAPGAEVLAGEVLGLTPAERRLVFSAAVADQPAIWGVPGPAAASTMKRLDIFLDRTGLDYAGVEPLLARPWIAGGLDLFIRHLDSSCDLASKEIQHLDDAVLDRVHRVLRLARRTGLAPRDVDRLASAPRLGGGDLGAAALQALSTLLPLAAALAVEPARLITWLDRIAVDGEPSDHALLFQNTAATGPLDPMLAPAALAANEAADTAVPGSGVRLAAVAEDLALAFGVGTSDMDLLVAHLGTAALLGPDPVLSAAALAAAFGRIGLARALGLGMPDYLMLERLSGADPLAGAAELAALVETARRVDAAAVPLVELEYRLARRAANLAEWDLADSAITTALLALRTALTQAQAEHASPYDAGVTALEQIPALELLLQRWPALDAGAMARLTDLVRAEPPTAAMGAAAKNVIDDLLAALPNAAAIKAAIDALVAALGAEPQRQALLQQLMQGLADHARMAAALDAAAVALQAVTATERALADVLLAGVRLAIAAVPTALTGLLTTGDIANPAVAITPAGTPNLYRALRLAHAVAGLATPFDPVPELLAFLLAKGPGLGWLALDTLPFETGGAVIALDSWLDLVDVFALARRFPAVDMPGQPGVTVTVAAVFDLALGAGPAPAPLLDRLAILTGWPRGLLGDVSAHFGRTLADYRHPGTWLADERALLAVHALGTDVTEAFTFCAENLGPTDAAAARRVLRTRHDPADWFGVLKTLMDPLRERKRDALVTQVLTTHPALPTKADLYDYLLTDTEWSARMPSSRLVHAHGTVQLFLRRCIEGLEPAAVADLDNDPDWRWWDSMKNYRVWEVGRKVFVDAQYYLRPEWRDDKTEAFADFERHLMENDVTEENVEAAFEGYLDRLDDIAFLDVLATCYDFDLQNLHVFAATKGGDPRGYYHRMLQRERSWTPWRKIDLDITGEHLIAFFRNNRLYLAWATFTEKGDETQSLPFPQPSGAATQPLPRPLRWTEISLAVSEYTGKKWLPRRVADTPIPTPKDVTPLDRKTIVLGVSPDPERFSVSVYHADIWPYLRHVGSFLLTGCKGYPEARAGTGDLIRLLPLFKDTAPRGQRLQEQELDADDELAYASVFGGSGFQLLFGRTVGQTPAAFRVTYPYQASELDRLLSALLAGATGKHSRDFTILIFGTLMPFFYEDNRRGFILIPGFYGELDPETGERTTAKTFSDVRQLVVDVFLLTIKYLQLLAAAPTQADKDAVIADLLDDPEYKRIVQEFNSYRGTRYGIVVRNFHHPLACHLRQQFFRGGIPALLARSTQLHQGGFVFEDALNGHAPAPVILPPFPREELEFDRASAYSDINWELTYHAPHLIATRMMEADDVEGYDAAETWLRYIFDPRGSSNDPAPQRYWNTKPFFQRGAAEYGLQLIDTILGRIAHDPNGVIETELANAVLEWRRAPFKPYLVARSRTVAFQQAIVELTARLFIRRGDAYFRRDQLEDLVMASLDYSRAERLLGARPRVVPPAVPVPPENYNQLAERLDLFGNALAKLENLLPDPSVLPHGGAELPPLPLSLESLYFCIPPSDKLFELWDTLAERQFNLRNSRNIDGVERELSLFAPPLSVEALLQAAASGLSISAILDALSAPRPPYRFRVMLRQAIELADVAASFAGRLEQALAARDNEGLQRLKAEHEGRLLAEQVRALELERDAAIETIASAQKARQGHAENQAFYFGRPYMNGWETAAVVSYGIATALQAVVAIGYAAAGGLSLVPSFMLGAAGFGGSPTVNAQTGGRDYSSSARDFVVGAVGALGATLEKAGAMLDHQGSYQVRHEDWQNSARAAQREMERADIEIRLANIRRDIAVEQLRVHGVRRQQGAAEEAYLRAKFTSRELFDWSAGQLRGLSRQMYNLAFEAARAAERCFQFELGSIDVFIRPGQWNDARQGLLAADQLNADLRRMSAAWLARNVRERELVSQLSLARLDPTALTELRMSGRCTIQVPEAVFDLEHPGHYFRRIKALQVTVPCVAGPYTGVPLKVTQTSNRIRVETGRRAGAADDVTAYSEDPAGDSRFRYNVGAIQSIATSRGQEDSGLFGLNFDDDRYLPFEGSGVIGTYVLELPPTLRPFDYGTISDVVLGFQYTARDGGGSLRTLAANTLRVRLNTLALKTGRTGLFQAFDLRRDRPDVWHRLTTVGSADLTLSAQDLPYFTAGHALALSAVRLIAKVDGAPANHVITVAGTPVTLNPAAEPELAGLLASTAAGFALDTPVTLGTALAPALRELLVIVNYTVTS